MPKIALKRTSLASFETLVRRVKETILLGRERVRKEMVETYWQTGRYIHGHILHHQARADYGEKLIPRLATRVEMSVRSLQEILRFYRKFPRITRSRAQLAWSLFRKLTSIPDESLRHEFAKRALEENWTSDKLQAKIRTELRPDSEPGGKSTSAGPDTSPLVEPKLGLLYTYRLVTTPAEPEVLKIDQGFHKYTTAFEARAKLKAGDIVESQKRKSGGFAAVPSKKGEKGLFTYRALVERVVDADTLFVEIDLGFGDTLRDYLRLRGINAPELSTEAGRKARDFVRSLVKNLPFILLTSTRSDKYHRYLADVFLPRKTFLKEWAKGTAALDPSSADLLYLNNELLAKHRAQRAR